MAKTSTSCQLCTHPTHSLPLCQPCREMVERLERIWPQVNPVTRGMLHYRTLQRAAAPVAAAGGCSTASQGARG